MMSAQRAYAMLGNETLWDTARRCHEVLAAAGIPHAIVGGVAVCLHGNQRNTVDLNLLVNGGDTAGIRASLDDAGFIWSEDIHEFRSPSGVAVQFLLSGERAGKGLPVRLPDPAEPNAVTERESLPVLSLAKLIESKIAGGLGNPRRTHEDFADVVELIALHDLGRDFARFLHRTLRKEFRQLVERVRGG